MYGYSRFLNAVLLGVAVSLLCLSVGVGHLSFMVGVCAAMLGMCLMPPNNRR